LLGSDSGQANDFQLPDGTVLSEPLSNSEILGQFASGWEISPQTSLLAGVLPTALSLGQKGPEFIGPQPTGTILTGSLGQPSMAGDQSTGVIFQGPLSHLASDSLTNIGPTDMLDITNLPFNVASASLQQTAWGSQLQVSGGELSGSLKLLGFSPAETTHLLSDGHGGSLVAF
jgi:hypothetical protein